MAEKIRRPLRTASLSARWKLLFLWILVGIVLGGFLLVSLGTLLDLPLLSLLLVHEPRWRTEDTPLLMEMSAVVLALVCLLLGMCQFLLIRRYVAHAVWWIPTWLLGIFLGGLGLGYVVFLVVNSHDDIIFGVSMGIVVGSLQWLILRTHFRGAVLWIMACALGGLAGSLAGPTIWADSLGLASGIVGMGMLTGPLLFFWLREDTVRSTAGARG